ncbi:MAG TPA: hypothetical protein VN605_06910, partial [Thermoanaerobaculia bacterium]|nr:hypothetical protein [Thermoanaerobaculia bacterium]
MTAVVDCGSGAALATTGAFAGATTAASRRGNNIAPIATAISTTAAAIHGHIARRGLPIGARSITVFG